LSGHRSPGLSALVRLRDEETWVKLALESITWFDEIVIVLNCCTDRTPEIVEDFRAQFPSKVIVADYPYTIHPMGPGHDDCPTDNPHSSAALYNFTQDLSTKTHVCKIDGDMVCMDWLGGRVRQLMEDGHHRIKMFGTDIVGDDLTHIGNHPLCPTNGVYQVNGTRYEQGQMTQSLRGAAQPTTEIHDCFLHFKWARNPFEAATVQWPENWQEIPHFQRIAERRIPVEPYTGEYPASVRALM